MELYYICWLLAGPYLYFIQVFFLLSLFLGYRVSFLITSSLRTVLAQNITRPNLFDLEQGSQTLKVFNEVSWQAEMLKNANFLNKYPGQS